MRFFLLLLITGLLPQEAFSQADDFFRAVKKSKRRRVVRTGNIQGQEFLAQAKNCQLSAQEISARAQKIRQERGLCPNSSGCNPGYIKVGQQCQLACNSPATYNSIQDKCDCGPTKEYRNGQCVLSVVNVNPGGPVSLGNDPGLGSGTSGTSSAGQTPQVDACLDDAAKNTLYPSANTAHQFRHKQSLCMYCGAPGFTAQNSNTCICPAGTTYQVNSNSCQTVTVTPLGGGSTHTPVGGTSAGSIGVSSAGTSGGGTTTGGNTTLSGGSAGSTNIDPHIGGPGKAPSTGGSTSAGSTSGGSSSGTIHGGGAGGIAPGGGNALEHQQ